ncbi:MAG: ShlB/FhaC/HecB family hemolysin secretion/activation protein [Candidatus Eremiobacteraeota bacterium]|nr:ShlB/FhaC/HecB family hemolysin secretion/activation protein [Candidatus Eremiobacteraeota bacterium]
MRLARNVLAGMWLGCSLSGWAQGPLEPAPQKPDLVQQEESPVPTASEKTILVSKFVVTGNTLLPPEELEKAYQSYQGQSLTLAQLREVARNLTAVYQRNGYFLVRAYLPQQSIQDGQVELRVIEGKVGKVNVEGAENYDPEFIRERFMNSFEGETFRNDRFQRAMLLMNELPDLQVQAVMAPGQEVGQTDVTLRVKDATPVHGGLDYNNYGTSATGENRIGLTFDAANILQQADQLTLRGVLGFPSRENSYYQINYQTPLNDDGTTINFGYANGAFAVSQGLGAILDVRGNADIYTVAVSHPLERQLEFSSNLGLAVSHKFIRNNFFGGQQPFSRDEYNSARLTYQADWRSLNGRTLLQAAYTQGLGGTPASDPLVSRAGASGGFAKFNVDLARIQNLDTGLYALFRASGQYATQPLYVAEQFAVGGPDTVRGYPQAQLLGDNAYVLGAELRWSPIEDDLDLFQVTAFIDHGGVSLRRALPGDLPLGSHLTGAGFGFRFGLQQHATLRLDLGFPISPTPSSTGRSPALYCGLQTRF